MGDKNKNKIKQQRTTIKLKGISKVYKRKSKEIHALKDVSLSVYEGELVAVVGESGSGKSTLLQIIGGLELPTTGSVEINGVDITKLSDSQRTLFRQLNIRFIF